MKITRNFDDVHVEIELTEDELFQAYLEQQAKYDIIDVEAELPFTEDDCADFKEEYGVDRNSLTEDDIAEIATEMRRNIDKYGCDFEFSRSEAIKTVVPRIREERERVVKEATGHAD